MKIFIPIKEHSSRVPRKNFRMFGDHQLFVRCFHRFMDFEIFVDTDSEEVIEKAKDWKNVTTYPRDQFLVGDDTPVNDLIEHFIMKYDFDEDEIICQIHATSPFLNPETIRQTELLMKQSNFDSIFSVTAHQSRFWRLEDYGLCPVNHNPVKLEKTQDLPPMYEENSSFYMFKAGSFLRYKNRIGFNSSFHIMSYPENVDIDTEQDWDRAIKILES